MYYVYILKSVNYNKTYTGITDNFKRRFLEHNIGKSTFTKKYLPWKLLFIEKLIDRNEARKREKYLKSCAGRKFIKRNYAGWCNGPPRLDEI